MAHSSQTSRNDAIGWVAQRIRDVLVLGAGIALALPLILPFA